MKLAQFPLICALIGVCLAGLGIASPAQEARVLLRQILVPGESHEAAQRLKAADRLVEPAPSPDWVSGVTALAATPPLGPLAAASAGVTDLISRQDWPAALREYQRLIFDEGDTLVSIGEPDAGLPTIHSRSLRWLCHRRIAMAPASVLSIHEKRLDPLAQKLFREGTENRDVRSLRRLVNDLFCSRFGATAAEFLGDLAFEKGEFAEAAQWWRLLALAAFEQNQPFFMPPTSGAGLDPARIRAKLILARAFSGDTFEAAGELKAFRAAHGNAQGKLAAKEGFYADIVEDVIARLPALDDDDEPWNTFAGNAARNRVPACPSLSAWLNGPAWRISLVPYPESEPLLARPGTRLCYYPIIADGRVVLADFQSVQGYDLQTGKPLFRYELPGHYEPDGSTNQGLRFTLTADRGRIYARLGAQAMAQGKQFSTAKSFVVCLEPPPAVNGRPAEGVRELWRQSAPGDCQFEGAPLVHAGLAYVAASNVVHHRTKTSIACYDATSGSLRWLEEICDTPTSMRRAGPRVRHHLLTLAADNVVYCSHTGAIVALDRLTGKRAWGVRYPFRQQDSEDSGTSPVSLGATSPRDLSPCIYHFGKLFVAPADSDSIFCFEASSGQLLWAAPFDPVHMLGAARSHLIFTTRRGLQAIDAHTGRGGWQRPEEEPLPGLGRGLLSGQWIFWPTRSPDFPMLVYPQSGGECMYPPDTRRILAGNMACAHGCLVAAGADELVAYGAPKAVQEKFPGKANALTDASKYR